MQSLRVLEYNIVKGREADRVHLATTEHKMNVHILDSNHVISLGHFIPVIYTI